MLKEYALYKGEECLCIGTIKEIAKQQNVKENTIRFYGYPAYTKKIKKNAKILIDIDDYEKNDKEEIMGREFYTKEEVCKLLKISSSLITKELRAGNLKGFKIKGEGNIVYFTPEEIRRYEQQKLQRRNRNAIIAVGEVGLKQRLEKITKKKGIIENEYILSALKERIEKDERG